MALELTVVDAFTDRPFSGNPAAVTVVEEFPDASYMQDVAREMNLSETAFVVARADGDFDLRWFSPTVEIDLCGHATLASAHVIGGNPAFHTRGGVLACRTAEDGMITMDFPAERPTPAEVPDGFTLPAMTGFHRITGGALVELENAHAVRTLVPDLTMVAALGTRVLYVTAAGDRPGIDCVSRVFAPNVGIPEDPVTGTAHCVLAEFWGERLGATTLVGEQASARGGIVHMTRKGERVDLGGRAVAVSTVRVLV